MDGRYQLLRINTIRMVRGGGGGAGGKHLPLPVPLLQPPVPFCELSSASRLFCNDLAMLLY